MSHDMHVSSSGTRQQVALAPVLCGGACFAEKLPHLCIKDVLDLDRVMRVELLCILTTIMEDLDHLAIFKQRFQLC